MFGKKWQTPGEGRGREPRVREPKMWGRSKGEQGGGKTRRDRETEGWRSQNGEMTLKEREREEEEERGEEGG